MEENNKPFDAIMPYEDFRSMVLSEEPLSYYGELKQSALRAYKHFLGKIDPTGIIDYLVKESDKIESTAREDRIIQAMYLLSCGIIELHNKHDDLKSILLCDQIPFLISRYTEKAQRSINQNKIKYMRNLVCNGFVNSSLSLDDKELFINILEEITFDQITILSILYNFKKNPDILTRKLYGNGKRDGTEYLIVNEIATLLEKDISNTKLLIANLIGKGLAIKVSRYLDVNSLLNDSKIGLDDFCISLIAEFIEVN